MWHISHFLGWQEYTVTYGKNAISALFKRLEQLPAENSTYRDLSLPKLHRCDDKSVAGIHSAIQAIEAVLPYICNRLLPTRIDVSRRESRL